MIWYNLNGDDFCPVHLFKSDRREIKRSRFPGGEVFIELEAPYDNKVMLVLRAWSSDDIFALLQAVDSLKWMNPLIGVNLFMPYFPYARQDRVMELGQALSVSMMARLINDLYLDSVIIFDPHSDVTPALLENVKVIDQRIFIHWVLQQEPNGVVLVGGDSSATKRIEKFGFAPEVIPCSKKRVKGHVDTVKVYGNVAGKDCLIVDDICDGGRTFVLLSQELKSQGAKSIALAVSHGIFSSGFVTLNQTIDRFYTTNSYPRPSADHLKVFPL